MSTPISRRPATPWCGPATNSWNSPAVAFSVQPGRRLLGVFSDGHTPFSVDRNNDPLLQMSVPSLAEMASAAIDRLKSGSNGFLLQIEGGRVDHGGHGNDLAALVYDQIAFEEAVKVAVDFALSNGETLVVITTDHACGGPSLNGAGHEYGDSAAGLRTLTGMKASYAEVWRRAMPKCGGRSGRR